MHKPIVGILNERLEGSGVTILTKEDSKAFENDWCDLWECYKEGLLKIDYHKIPFECASTSIELERHIYQFITNYIDNIIETKNQHLLLTYTENHGRCYTTETVDVYDSPYWKGDTSIQLVERTNTYFHNDDVVYCRDTRRYEHQEDASYCEECDENYYHDCPRCDEFDNEYLYGHEYKPAPFFMQTSLESRRKNKLFF